MEKLKWTQKPLLLTESPLLSISTLEQSTKAIGTASTSWACYLKTVWIACRFFILTLTLCSYLNTVARVMAESATVHSMQRICCKLMEEECNAHVANLWRRTTKYERLNNNKNRMVPRSSRSFKVKMWQHSILGVQTAGSSHAGWSMVSLKWAAEN